jgi:hypothetical protein
MSAIAQTFQPEYAAAFHAFLGRRDEGQRRLAYELGREAVAGDLTVLDLAVAHHEALAAELSESENAEDVATAAGDFFLEALSAFEMAQRVYRDGRARAALERRQAALLRQLSNFLADASLALGASDSLGEMLQLVAEQARELVGADRCRVVLGSHEGAAPIEAISEAKDAVPTAGSSITTELTALDGRILGRVELAGKTDGEFTSLDEAVLTQLAQMASAAVERRALYRR